jgi:hypothetical protein
MGQVQRGVAAPTELPAVGHSLVFNDGALVLSAEGDLNDIDAGYEPAEPGDSRARGARLARLTLTTSQDLIAARVVIQAGPDTIFDSTIGPSFAATWTLSRTPRRTLQDLSVAVSMRSA